MTNNTVATFNLDMAGWAFRGPLSVNVTWAG